MALMSLQEISLSFGGPLIFDQLNFQLETGERVALLGRNGTGKTTLMKVLSGEVIIDTGKIIADKDIRVTYLPQEIPEGVGGTVYDLVAAGLGAQAEALRQYHQISHELETKHTPALMARLNELHSELDRTQGWEVDYRVKTLLAALDLETLAEREFERLSGGQKRRVLLAKAVIAQPDLLMLDEPTNHLDLASILWLEQYLKNFKGTLLLITHDREFMTQVATRIAEIDRGRVVSWACSYPVFLQRKQKLLDAEAVARAEMDKKLEQEEIWIRQGVQARRTRNEGRVRALMRLREQKRAQRNVLGSMKAQTQESELSGRRVAKLVRVNHRFSDQWLIRNFTANIMRGDRIGILGPNGCGKSTLIKLILGEITPENGTVSPGRNIEIAYFDQMREQIDGDKSVAANVAGMSEVVTINGKERHIIGYLRDFLFSFDRAGTPARVLSGGERNRLLLARLFTRSFNFLIMDEPTNDLDIETLELLEELLLEYDGTLLVISHDRFFLNQVVTSTWAFEGQGQIHEYAGGYDDWLKQRPSLQEKPKEIRNPKKRETLTPENPEAHESSGKNTEKKLSYKEKRELELLPAKIESLEKKQEELLKKFQEAGFYQQDPKVIAEVQEEATVIARELKAAYARWEMLEEAL